MKNSFLYSIILLIIACLPLLQGCNPTCKVKCRTVGEIVLVNFPFQDLDTVIINEYQPDGKFVIPEYTYTIPKYSTYAGKTSPNWNKYSFYHNSAPDTTSDSLVCSNFGYVDFTGSLYDVEVIVVTKGVQTVLRVSGIRLAGESSQNQYCREGDANPGYCSMNLVSYSVNGKQVNFPPNGTIVYGSPVYNSYIYLAR